MEEESTAITSQILEEKIYVAVGKEVWKNTSNLIWALENYQENKICILHIHQPSPTIPILGGRFEASTADEELVRAYREKETAKTDKILEEYLTICLKKGAMFKQRNSVSKRIPSRKGLWKRYTSIGSRSLLWQLLQENDGLKSRKANFVCEQANVTCQIEFTCKGNLSHTREARKDEFRALSTLLSEFQQLVLPLQISTNEIQEVGSSNGKIEMESNQTSSRQSLSESSSQLFPCKGMGMNNVINFLINSTKLWQELTIQNQTMSIVSDFSPVYLRYTEEEEEERDKNCNETELIYVYITKESSTTKTISLLVLCVFVSF